MSNPNIKDHSVRGGKIRWMPKATHQGILKIMGKELPCVVLEDGRRLITQASVFKTFGLARRGSKDQDPTVVKMPGFLDAKNLKSFISEEVLSVIRPVCYMNNNKTESMGYSAEIIPLVCDVYLSARKEGVLTDSQGVRAEISEQLVRALSKVGIISLVDEATGYQQVRPRDALEAYLNKILSKELASWCKRFPDIYYENIYKLKGWPEFSTSKNKYSCVGHYTNDIIYSRLGEDVLDELKTRTPDTSKNKLHQWLSIDTGHPLLSQHMSIIIALQKLAIAQGYGWKRFLDMVNLTLPKKAHALELKE